MRYFVYLTLILVFTALSSCDNSMDPFNKEKGVYSIYGYLDLDKNVNYIRVKDLNKPLSRDSTDEIDATVTLENVTENKVETLQDTLFKYQDVYTHNFPTTMEINPGDKYQVTAERSDGELVTATATAPQIADANWGPTDSYCQFPIEITFEPVEYKYDLELSIGFDYQDIRYWVNPDVSQVEGKLIVYRFTPNSIINDFEIACHNLDDDKLFAKYTHYGPDFDHMVSGNSEDPEKTVTFGALYEDSFSFKIDTTNIPCPPICTPEDTVTRSISYHELRNKGLEP